MSAGPGGLSHLASAFQRGLLRRLPDPIEVSVLDRPRPGPRPGVIVHRPRTLDATDIEKVNGLACTSLARTLVDIASAHEYLLEPVTRQAEYKGFLTPVTALSIIDTTRGLNGAPAVRELLASASLDAAGLDSELERRVAQLMTDGQVPPGVRQQRFDLRPDHRRVVVDFWWPQARLVVEVDGPHHELPIQAAHDRRRDAALARRAIHVHRVPHTVIRNEPWTVAPAILALLHARLGS